VLRRLFGKGDRKDRRGMTGRTNDQSGEGVGQLRAPSKRFLADSRLAYWNRSIDEGGCCNTRSYGREACRYI